MSKALTTSAAARGFGMMLDRTRETLDAHRTQGVSVDKLVAGAKLAAATTPALYGCSPQSVLIGVYQAARLGLELGGPMGHCYLLPYKGTAKLIVGYKGMIELALRSGRVTSIIARIVREGDHFDVVLGTEERVTHIPKSYHSSARPPVATYAVAQLAGGGRLFDWMTMEEVEAIRARSPSGDDGPWVTDTDQMIRKTMIRRLANVLPMSPELASAMEMVDREMGAPARKDRAMDALDGEAELVEVEVAP